MQGAEDEASVILRAIFAGLPGAGGILGAVGGALSPALGHVGDFFVGMWEEGKDMVMGLYNLVTDPIGTAKDLWHGITHPGAPVPRVRRRGRDQRGKGIQYDP